MSARPILIWWQLTTSGRRVEVGKRWLWLCRICRLECTYPNATLPEAYSAALGHLSEEHLGARA